MFNLFKKKLCLNCQCTNKVVLNDKIKTGICGKCSKQGYFAIPCKNTTTGKDFFVVCLQHI